MSIKPTPIFVLGIAILIIGIPSGIYGLTLKGGSSLGGVLILIGMIGVAISVVIDRVLINYVRLKILITLEIAILMLGAIYYFYSNREIQINVLNEEFNCFLVIDEKSLEQDQFSYKFPFDKYYVTERNFIVVKNATNNIDFNLPKHWNGSYSYDIYSCDKYSKVYIFGNTSANFKINRALIDSIVVE